MNEKLIDANTLYPELHRDPGRALREEAPRPGLHPVGDFRPRRSGKPVVPRPVQNPPLKREREEAGAAPLPTPGVLDPEVFAGLFSQTPGGYYLWSGVEWDDFVAKWQALAPENLRLVSVDTQLNADGVTLFTGAWIESSQGYALYRTADLQAFVNLFEQSGNAGLWLADVHVDNAGGQRFFTGVWLGGLPKQKLVVGLGWEAFEAEWKRLSETEGYRLVRFQAYPYYDGVARFLGVFEEGGGGYAMIAISDWSAFLAEVDRWSAMQLVDFRVFDDAGVRWYLGVWRETSTAHTFVYGQDWTSFLSSWTGLAQQGQLLRTVRLYPQTLQAIDPDWQGVFDAALGSTAEGYAWIAFKDGQLVAEGQAGDVRSPYQTPNGNVSWTLDSRINLASVSKPITAVGVIKLLNDQGISLDTPFFPSIQNQVPTVGPGVDTVTFRDLLTMKSGLQPDGTLYLSEPFWDFLNRYLQQGLVGTPGVTYAYSNTNFSILAGAIEEISGSPYVEYMKPEVLTSMGISTGLFNPVPDPSDTATLSYSGQGDQTGGQFWPEMQMVGPGGWIAPANELIKFLTGVRNDAVLSAALTEEMLTGELGWYTYNGKYGAYYHHNGGLVNGATPTQGLNTGIIHFSNGYDALLLVNSPLPTIISLMIQAFETQK